MLIKLTKIKHKQQILKAAREKQQITYKGITMRPTADLSTETVQAGRKWQDMLKAMKKTYSQDYSNTARICFRFEGEIKSFIDKQKLKRIQHHQTSFITKVKGTPLDRGTQQKEKAYKNKPKTIK